MPLRPAPAGRCAPAEGASGGNVFAFTSGATARHSPGGFGLRRGRCGTSTQYAMTCTEVDIRHRAHAEKARSRSSRSRCGERDSTVHDPRCRRHVPAGCRVQPVQRPRARRLRRVRRHTRCRRQRRGAATATPPAAATAIPGGAQPTTTGTDRTAGTTTPSGSVDRRRTRAPDPQQVEVPLRCSPSRSSRRASRSEARASHSGAAGSIEGYDAPSLRIHSSAVHRDRAPRARGVRHWRARTMRRPRVARRSLPSMPMWQPRACRRPRLRRSR